MTPKESPSEKKDGWKKLIAGRRGKWLLCLGVLFSVGVMLLGGWLVHLFLRPAPSPVVVKNETTGFLRLQDAIKAHEDYGKLQDMQKKCRVLKEEIKDALQPTELLAPQVDEKPFDDSVWQKNAQNIIGQRAEIEREKKKAAEAYRMRTEDAYAERCEALNAKYATEMMNVRLKLDNADVLHLSRDAVEDLANRLRALQQERIDGQRRLLSEREQEVKEAAAKAVSGRLGKWREEALASKAALESAKAKAMSEAQARDMQKMEQQMAEPMRFQKLMEKRQELAELEEKATALESHILNDIAGKAAKLAIIHHFDMIIANPAVRLESLIPWEDRVGAETERYAPVVASGVTDITDELIAEFKHD